MISEFKNRYEKFPLSSFLWLVHHHFYHHFHARLNVIITMIIIIIIIIFQQTKDRKGGERKWFLWIDDEIFIFYYLLLFVIVCCCLFIVFTEKAEDKFLNVWKKKENFTAVIKKIKRRKLVNWIIENISSAFFSYCKILNIFEKFHVSI